MLDNCDPFLELDYRFLHGWHKEPVKDSNNWLDLLNYARAEYVKKFGTEPNVGFVNPTTFSEKCWRDDKIIVFKTWYCLSRTIFLGELDDALFQDLQRQAEYSENDSPVQV